MKTADEIYTSLMSQFEALTGFGMSSEGELALRFRACAAEISALYAQCDFTLRQCFPQSAAGEYLDRFAAMRSLSRRAAVKAAGEVTFTLSGAAETSTVIPAGTVCLSGGQVRFLTDAAAVIPAGSLSVTAAVTAAEAGSFGNVPTGSITAMAVAPAGVASCQNAAATAGGADEESDAELRARVLATYDSLPNGANAAYYRSSAMSVSGVAAAHVVPRISGAGTVGVVIASESGVPASTLISAVQAKLESEREIAVTVTVSAPETVAVTLSVAVQPVQGVSFSAAQTAVTAAVNAYFTGALLGKSVTLAALGALIYSLNEVENYSISLPAADVAVQGGELPVLQGLTVTEMGA